MSHPPEFEALPNAGTLVGRHLIVREIAKGTVGPLYLARSEGADADNPSAIDTLARVIPLPSDLPARDDQYIAEAIWDSANVGHDLVLRVADVIAGKGWVTLIHDYHVGSLLSSMHRRAKDLASGFPAEIAARIALDVLEGLEQSRGLCEANRIPWRPGSISIGSLYLCGDGRTRALDGQVVAAVMRSAHMRMLCGTASNVAPEILDAAREPDERTDVFSVGALLWELLTGRDIFVTGNAPIANVRDSVPKDTEVPHGLEHALHRALDLDPGRRQSTLRELAVELVMGAEKVATYEQVVEFASTLLPFEVAFRRETPSAVPSANESPARAAGFITAECLSAAARPTVDEPTIPLVMGNPSPTGTHHYASPFEPAGPTSKTPSQPDAIAAPAPTLPRAVEIPPDALATPLPIETTSSPPNAADAPDAMSPKPLAAESPMAVDATPSIAANTNTTSPGAVSANDAASPLDAPGAFSANDAASPLDAPGAFSANDAAPPLDAPGAFSANDAAPPIDAPGAFSANDAAPPIAANTNTTSPSAVSANDAPPIDAPRAFSANDAAPPIDAPGAVSANDVAPPNAPNVGAPASMKSVANDAPGPLAIPRTGTELAAAASAAAATSLSLEAPDSAAAPAGAPAPASGDGTVAALAGAAPSKAVEIHQIPEGRKSNGARLEQISWPEDEEMPSIAGGLGLANAAKKSNGARARDQLDTVPGSHASPEPSSGQGVPSTIELRSEGATSRRTEASKATRRDSGRPGSGSRSPVSGGSKSRPSSQRPVEATDAIADILRDVRSRTKDGVEKKAVAAEEKKSGALQISMTTLILGFSTTVLAVVLIMILLQQRQPVSRMPVAPTPITHAAQPAAERVAPDPIGTPMQAAPDRDPLQRAAPSANKPAEQTTSPTEVKADRPRRVTKPGANANTKATTTADDTAVDETKGQKRPKTYVPNDL